MVSIVIVISMGNYTTTNSLALVVYSSSKILLPLEFSLMNVYEK